MHGCVINIQNNASLIDERLNNIGKLFSSKILDIKRNYNAGLKLAYDRIKDLETS